MLRRLHPEQPDGFAFTPANLEWAKGQIAKYPAGRQASAVIPLLWRAQEQEGWVSRPAIEEIARMLDMASIRVLEVATFYFMFQLQPVGSIAHVQVCGTTSCMICGAEDLVRVCREKIAVRPHALSPDGRFTWEEVECLGACANAPMVQIGKDYYEDLTAERFSELLDAFARGEVPRPGPQNGRFASEPRGGLTSLGGGEAGYEGNASVTLALDADDTVARIAGGEAPLRMRPAGPLPSTEAGPPPPGAVPGPAAEAEVAPEAAPAPAGGEGANARVRDAAKAAGEAARLMDEPVAAPAQGTPDPHARPETARPASLEAPRGGGPDDLTRIRGVGPKLEEMLHRLGFFHFDQIASWTAEEVAWVDENLEGFRGRVTRDGWVEQAKVLAAGGETEFSRHVDEGDVY
jgi:NADH-quinone oxidoreductase subunit E